MFDEVTRTEGRTRAIRRSAWVVGSTLLQAGVVVGILSFSTSPVLKVDEGPIVEVKFVKGAPRPLTATPPPAPPRKKTPPRPRAEAPKPPPALVQPKDVPAEMTPPAPNEPSGPEYEGPDVGGGVIGGMAGGAIGGAAAPARLEFNDTMAPPVFVSGPNPEYTKQALMHEVDGLMIVKCVITVDGRVHDCRVLRSLPFMDRAVVDALEHRRYKPATLGGKALEVDYTFRIRLTLP